MLDESGPLFDRIQPRHAGCTEAKYLRDEMAIVIGLPWLACGSGQVMSAQLRFLGERGCRPLFIAVPFEACQRAQNEVWTRFNSQKSELQAENIFISTFNRRPTRGGRLGRFLAKRRDLTALHWSIKVSASAPVTEEIERAVSEKEIPFILANHVYTLGFARKLQSRLARTRIRPKLLVVTHDVQSHIVRDNAILNPWTEQPDGFERLLATELEALRWADALIHVSVDDYAFFAELLPEKPHFLVLPAIDAVDLNTLRNSPPLNDLLFVGSDHIANLKALEWYFDRVVPGFPAESPSLEIVGRIDHLVRHRNKVLWDQHSRLFTGIVPDTLPHYARSRASIMPMKSGRGISVKTIEALAAGMPVVGTRLAYRGFPMDVTAASGLPIAETEREFADAIQAALDRPSEFAEMSRRLHRQLFSFDQFSRAMEEALQNAL
jgi:polysaccharide biosynthesis protein PslH